MVKFPKIRGTEDRFDKEANNFSFLINLFTKVSNLYGYRPIITPLMENADLFVRSVGDTSDIVTKEFYDFKDKGDRHVVLRPEGTAGVIRALIEEKLIYSKPLPLKVCYSGSMFRYERPQSGRLRQFNQFGVECVGTNSFYDDVDCVMLVNTCFRILGIKDYTISVNNIGSFESRSKWINELKKYFKKYEKDLTEDSVKRIQTNPLRILDDKVDGKKEFVKNAPKIDAFLTKNEVENFNNIINILTTLKVNFIVDKTLVRGLDYYSNFVFEFNSTRKELIGQPTLAGGGRYSYLVKELGGTDLSCCGFAIGIERMLIQLEAEGKNPVKPNSVDVCVACLYDDPKAKNLAEIIINTFRLSGISCIANLEVSKLEKNFKFAKDNNAKFVVIIGQKEIESKTIVVKDQTTMEQKTIENTKLFEYIKNKLK